jgi:hypothetical protein
MEGRNQGKWAKLRRKEGRKVFETNTKPTLLLQRFIDLCLLLLLLLILLRYYYYYYYYVPSLLKAAINNGFSKQKMRGITLLTKKLFASQKEPSSAELLG